MEWIKTVPTNWTGIVPPTLPYNLTNLFLKSNHWKTLIKTIEEDIMPIWPEYKPFCSPPPPPPPPPPPSPPPLPSVPSVPSVPSSVPAPIQGSTFNQAAQPSHSESFTSLEFKKELITGSGLGFEETQPFLNPATTNPTFEDDGFEAYINRYWTSCKLLTHTHTYF
jgi:hypothetical protein